MDSISAEKRFLFVFNQFVYKFLHCDSNSFEYLYISNIIHLILITQFIVGLLSDGSNTFQSELLRDILHINISKHNAAFRIKEIMCLSNKFKTNLFLNTFNFSCFNIYFLFLQIFIFLLLLQVYFLFIFKHVCCLL